MLTEKVPVRHKASPEGNLIDQSKRYITTENYHGLSRSTWVRFAVISFNNLVHIEVIRPCIKGISITKPVKSMSDLPKNIKLDGIKELDDLLKKGLLESRLNTFISDLKEIN